MGKLKQFLKKKAKKTKEEMQKKAMKTIINNALRKLEKYRQKIDEKNEEKERKKIIRAIWSLSEMITVEEEDGTEQTITSLNKMETQDLIERLEGMIQEAEKNI